MAVGTMVLQNRSFVNVSGPPVTITLNNAPAKDALMALARLADYGFVFISDLDDDDDQLKASNEDRLVSMSFQSESYARALNSVLLASGLQGRLDGRTLLVGRTAASKAFGPQVSKVIRLNQVTANAAGKYLGNLGATVNFTNTVTVTAGEPASVGTAEISSVVSQKRSTLTTTESFGAATGPLRGLVMTTDSRLQTVTLVGDSLLIKAAENYLKQIDLRQRQVALSVRILDVSLDNNAAMQNSFAFRNGNNFIVSDRGELVGAFGSLLPPNNNNFDVISGSASSGKSEYVEIDEDSQIEIREPLDPARINPGNVFTENQFFDLLRSLIVSGSTKTLASPTLILSENSDELTGGAYVSASDVESALNNSTIGRPLANESFLTVGTQEIVVTRCRRGRTVLQILVSPNLERPDLLLELGFRRSMIMDLSLLRCRPPSLLLQSQSQLRGVGLSVFSVFGGWILAL